MKQIEPQGKAFIEKYEVERIIVDSDFDGVICGALLRKVFPKVEIIQSKASEIQEGVIDHLITSKTLMADLRFSPKCGYFFDHHESNRPESGFIGEWKLVDSAAQVIYSYFQDAADFSDFDALMMEINKFDSGNISLEDFLNPNDTYKLALIISRDKKYFNLLLIELLSRMSLHKVCKHPYVKEKIDRYLALRSEMSDYVMKNSEIINDVVFVNLRSYKLQEKMTSYVYTAEHTKSKVIVVEKPHEREGWSKIRLYRNNFHTVNNDINLLEIAKKISPKTAGGHKGACGFNIEGDLDKAKLVGYIQAALKS